MPWGHCRRMAGRCSQAPVLPLWPLGFGPDGSQIACYAKLFPFSVVEEGRYYQPGEEIVTFRWNQFIVAPSICYDLRFPEIYRLAARRGANLFIVIACWPASRAWIKETLLKARALENQAYVVGVNRCGADPQREYPGQSVIINPRGEAVAMAGGAEEIIRHQPELAALEKFRREFPVLRDMRNEFFPPES